MPPPDLERLLSQTYYPAMNWTESRLTEAWLRAFGRDYDELDFNVRLGPEPQLPFEAEESTRRLAAAVLRPRADLIAWWGGGVTIVEVKVRVGLSALGQLIGYRVLWNQMRPEAPVKRLLIVGRSMVEGVAATLLSVGVDWELFPEVPLSPAGGAGE